MAPCRLFAQGGHCKFGAKCRFSHGAERNARNSNQTPREMTTTEKSYRQWLYMIPKPDSARNREIDFRTFFQAGHRLMEADDPGTRQLIIAKLGSDGGLQMISSLVDLVNQNQGPTAKSIFTECTVPFFQTISHPGVLSSLLLENQVAAIYNFLFGPHGERGLQLFRLSAISLLELLTGDPENDLTGLIVAISSTLVVLEKLIELNQNAQIIKGFTTVVENLSACIPEDLMVVGAQQSLDRIKRRLEIGSSLPLATGQAALPVYPIPSFELPQDMPGTLSNAGARHDNDHADITRIKILPTTQEIASTRPEYLPHIDSARTHLSGLARLLDRQFRLLREDSIGQLRDAVREEITRLGETVSSTRQSSQRQGVRKLLYHNVRFTSLFVDRRKGLQVVAEFDQPAQVKNKSTKNREEWWKSSKLLQVDSLVCFVSTVGRVIFFCVGDAIFHRKQDEENEMTEQEEVLKHISLFHDPDQAQVLLSLAEYNEPDVVWISTHIERGLRGNVRQTLVEFPGILLPSFQPTLKALQKMSNSLDLPFAEIITPESNQTAPAQPPAYATRGFSFKLDILTGSPLTFTPGQSFDFDGLRSSSCSLDEAQQHALIHSLGSGLALTQGPPGTGKSFTGVSIIQTLLQNRVKADLGPIICVCYTNHALDQLLEHLVQSDVKQIIRLGSRSKSEILKGCTLNVVRKGVEASKHEKSSMYESHQSIKEILEEIEEVLPSLNDPTSWRNINDHLKENHPRHFNELFGRGVDNDGFREVRGKVFQAVGSWLRNAPKDLDTNRPIDQLHAKSLNELSSKERNKLHASWIQGRTRTLTDKLLNILDSYHGSKSDLDTCHRELDLRCLQGAHIIGVTTSGLARNLDLLRRVQAKVVLCEEAGEVLEAHTLTAFLPGVEHVILIGDHEQLRPQINNYELQHDNPRGQKYSLDISLFERLVRPRTGQTQLPLSTLNIQRRMHPSISELVRVPLYPDLVDHPSVSNYPEVVGMRKRLYWLDHQEKEDPRIDSVISLSRTNSHEVELVASLVSHLVKQSTYGEGDIAVLTPYLGQLQQLRRRLASISEIVVGDRDQDELEAEGMANEITDDASGVFGQTQKTTLLNTLRLATVDNFQGEEANVIIISLVRSNVERSCGFLKTSNRINVLLSRARHGMYVIGNADTARPVPMWDQVLNILERENNIGPSLALCCPRHTGTSIEVSTPDDFVRFAPEGGCSEKCKDRLPCGHACINMCHSLTLHNAVRCLERCPRTKKGCQHECPKVCGDKCDAQCQVLVFGVKLPCGHSMKKMKCYEAQEPNSYKCPTKVHQNVNACGHTIEVACHEVPLAPDYQCWAVCGAILPCGHNCTRPCKDCNKKVDGAITEKIHLNCRVRCSRPYTTCSHSCQALCHDGVPCSSCEDPCEVKCAHSNCSKKCNEPCVPCAENCTWSCTHQGRCQLPCAVPCDLLPCGERCSQLLACGHRCPSVCGDICPDARFCQTCAKPSIKKMTVDFIESLSYEEINLDENPCIVPSCGHILTLESMDGHMSMTDFYSFDNEGKAIALKDAAKPFSFSEMKSCPTCRAPLTAVNRYSRIIRRALIDESTKKFVIWSNSKFVPFTEKMQAIETNLRKNNADGEHQNGQPDKTVATTNIPKIHGTRDVQFNYMRTRLPKLDQRASLVNLRMDIHQFLAQVSEKEQPFGRVYDLAQDARRHRGVESDLNSHVDMLQTRSRLLTTVLLIRCDYIILSTFLSSRENSSLPNPQIDLRANRKDCENLIEDATTRSQPGCAVEGHFYWARLAALEYKFPIPKPKSNTVPATTNTTNNTTPHTTKDNDPLLTIARQHLQTAEALCKHQPSQTRGLASEISDIEKLIRGSTFYLPVTNDEKAAVYAAMAQDFRGTGHWYSCVNGHPFTVGECGMPMETSRCPQCGATVGGQDHSPVEGVTRAEEMDAMFGRWVI